MSRFNKYIFSLTAIVFLPIIVFAQSEIELKGVLVDSTDYSIPYAAVSLLKNKNAGAYSTEDGEFEITITESDLLDTLSISCIGYKTLKLSIKDFRAQKEQKIIVAESVTSLSEVEILSANQYALRALKNLKNSTIRKKHQINALYRVTTTEGGKAKRFVEYFVKIYDYGPVTPIFSAYEFAERRQSADYRTFIKDETVGNFKNLNNFNILRNPNTFKKSKWKKIGDTSYDGEDIVILQNSSNTKIYVGLKDYGVYKITKGNLLYVYNKDSSGKLHLGYHKREWKSTETINDKKIKTSIRYEFITLNVITDKRKIERINNMGLANSNNNPDIKFKTNDSWAGNGKNKTDKTFSGFQKSKSNSSQKLKLDQIKYNETFWVNLQLPPETKFLKKIKEELESHYGISFDDQLKLVNK